MLGIISDLGRQLDVTVLLEASLSILYLILYRNPAKLPELLGARRSASLQRAIKSRVQN